MIIFLIYLHKVYIKGFIKDDVLHIYYIFTCLLLYLNSYPQFIMDYHRNNILEVHMNLFNFIYIMQHFSFLVNISHTKTCI